MELRPFRIERYYARYEFATRYMLSSSDCESRTISELLELEPDAHARLLETWCGYTESAGAAELRQAIAALYEPIDPDQVIVTSCAEEGIFLLYHALLGPATTRSWRARVEAHSVSIRPGPGGSIGDHPGPKHLYRIPNRGSGLG